MASNSTSTTSQKQPQPEGSDSFPLAAQIPLQTFQLPQFPEQASRLRELTLTADIKLDEYQNILNEDLSALNAAASITAAQLPASITHLTLELFSLGFPALTRGDISTGFLSELTKGLSNVRALTLFSTLIDGLGDSSRSDAEAMFTELGHLNEVHIIDSFVRQGFWSQVAKNWEERAKRSENEAVRVIEMSYTYRGHDELDFLNRIHGDELIGLVGKGTVGASFGFVNAFEEAKELGEEEGDGKHSLKPGDGVLPFATDGRASAVVKKRFEILGEKKELADLRVLNLSMWTLTCKDLSKILVACAGGGEAKLVDLTVSILLEDRWWDELLEACRNGNVASSIEGLEIIGVPSQGNQKGEAFKVGGGLIKESAQLDKLGSICPRLTKFEMNILKAMGAGIVRWTKVNGAWKQE